MNGTFSKTAISASLVDIAVINVNGARSLWADLKAAGANLTALAIEMQYRPAGPWLPVAANSGSYTTPVAPLLKTSGDMSTANIGVQHYFKMDVTGLFAIRIRGSAASTLASVSGGYGGG